MKELYIENAIGTNQHLFNCIDKYSYIQVNTNYSHAMESSH